MVDRFPARMPEYHGMTLQHGYDEQAERVFEAQRALLAELDKGLASLNEERGLSLEEAFAGLEE